MPEALPAMDPSIPSPSAATDRLDDQSLEPGAGIPELTDEDLEARIAEAHIALEVLVAERARRTLAPRPPSPYLRTAPPDPEERRKAEIESRERRAADTRSLAARIAYLRLDSAVLGEKAAAVPMAPEDAAKQLEVRLERLRAGYRERRIDRERAIADAEVFKADFAEVVKEFERRIGDDRDEVARCDERIIDHYQEALGALTAREQSVLGLRFGLIDGQPRSLEEAGHTLHVTRERVRQIEAKALRKLRHPSRRRALGDHSELDDEDDGFNPFLDGENEA